MKIIDSILSAREKRAELIDDFINQHKRSLICITFNIPGPKKTGHLIDKAFIKVTDEIINIFNENNFKIILFKRNLNYDGNEAFYIFDESKVSNSKNAYKLKHLSVEIEKKHTLGRLLDIDVYKSNKVQISRTQIGESTRKCLICSKEARNCIINKNHSLKELNEKINSLINKYLYISRC